MKRNLCSRNLNSADILYGLLALVSFNCQKAAASAMVTKLRRASSRSMCIYQIILPLLNSVEFK